MVEIWKTTHCSSNYQVSNRGNVRRITSYGGLRLLDFPKPITPTNDRGYRSVMFSDGDEGFTRTLVHLLMVHAFWGGVPEGKVVTHRNGVRSDNRLENLEYTTRSAILYEAYRTEAKTAKRENNPNSKLTDATVIEIRDRYRAGGISQAELGRQFNVTQRTISYAVRKKTWAGIPNG